MTLTADLFEPHVGTEAIVHLDDGTPFALTLNSVTPEGPVVPREAGDDTPRQGPFSMILQGPHSPVIAALTYPVTIGDAAPVHLFVSPHYQDADKTLYNIVVS